MPDTVLARSVLSLDEDLDERVVGGKAAGLSRLLRLGVAVPRGLVIPASATPHMMAGGCLVPDRGGMAGARRAGRDRPQLRGRRRLGRGVVRGSARIDSGRAEPIGPPPRLAPVPRVARLGSRARLRAGARPRARRPRHHHPGADRGGDVGGAVHARSWRRRRCADRVLRRSRRGSRRRADQPWAGDRRWRRAPCGRRRRRRDDRRDCADAGRGGTRDRRGVRCAAGHRVDDRR